MGKKHNKYTHAIFNTTQSDMLDYNGTTVKIAYELGDEERDPEVGRMWHIVFDDGTESDAFEDELKFIK